MDPQGQRLTLSQGPSPMDPFPGLSRSLASYWGWPWASSGCRSEGESEICMSMSSISPGVTLGRLCPCLEGLVSLFSFLPRVSFQALAVVLSPHPFSLKLPRECSGKESTGQCRRQTQETWVRSLGQEDPLEEGVATHSIILAQKMPWTEEPGGLQSMESWKSWI